MNITKYPKYRLHFSLYNDHSTKVNINDDIDAQMHYNGLGAHLTYADSPILYIDITAISAEDAKTMFFVNISPWHGDSQMSLLRPHLEHIELMKES